MCKTNCSPECERCTKGRLSNRALAHIIEFASIVFLLLVLLFASKVAKADDIPVFPLGPQSFPIALNQTWAGSGNGSINNFYRYAPLTSMNSCISFVNNDVGTHTINVVINVTDDASATFAGSRPIVPVANNGFFPLSQLAAPGIGGQSVITVFVPTSGAAIVYLLVGGGAGAGTASIFLTQTMGSSCMGAAGTVPSMGVGLVVQGAQSGSNPLPMGGVEVSGATANVAGVAVANNTSYPVSTTLTGRSQTAIGPALLTEKGGRWTVDSVPAVSAQASAVQTGAEAGVRHVLDCVSFSAAATTAIGAAQFLTVDVLDGATVVHGWELFIPASTGQIVVPFSVCGLNITGTSSTTMTVQFSGAVTNLKERVSMTGFNIQF